MILRYKALSSDQRETIQSQETTNSKCGDCESWRLLSNTECLLAAAVKCSQCKQVSVDSLLVSSHNKFSCFYDVHSYPGHKNATQVTTQQPRDGPHPIFSKLSTCLKFTMNTWNQIWVNVSIVCAKKYVNRRKKEVVAKSVFIKECEVRWWPHRSLPVPELHVTKLVTLGHGKMWI